MNEKIQEALKDRNLQGIMNKAASTFTKQLSQDEIHTCKLNALWKSLKHWDENKNSKFSSYLYNGVKFECIREVKFKKKDHGQGNKCLEQMLASKDDHVGFVDILDEIDSLPDHQLIHDRSEKYTVKEIADRNGLNRETARRKIKKSAKRLANRIN